MDAVLWWLIPLGATLIAIAWVTWRGRPRPPADTHDSLAEHQRFREAMARRTRREPPSDGTGQ